MRVISTPSGLVLTKLTLRGSTSPDCVKMTLIQERKSTHDLGTSQPPCDHPMESAVICMSEANAILFRSALYLTIQERPFRDFSSLIELQQVNGMKLGETYNSNKQAREFLRYIVDNCLNQLVHLLGQSRSIFLSDVRQCYRF